MRPIHLMLCGGFTVLALAYLAPLITDLTLLHVAWSVGVAAAIAGMEGRRRARNWNPGDYA